jgi:general stress protein YciG
MLLLRYWIASHRGAVMEKIKSKRGFASMSPEKRAAIASMGGKAVKPENRAFSKDRTLASRSGKKGGKVSKKKPVG